MEADATSPDFNPYSPPAAVGKLPVDSESEPPPFRPRSWLKSFGLWTLVCSVSAIPSFAWGIWSIATDQALAMIFGVMIFILLYTVGDQVTQNKSWRRNQSLRLTFKIGYVTRMIVSIIFPIGGFLDMFCGIISVSAVGALVNVSPGFESGTDGANFLATLMITLVQGCLLNIVLAGFMLVVFGIVLLVHRGQTGSIPP